MSVKEMADVHFHTISCALLEDIKTSEAIVKKEL